MDNKIYKKVDNLKDLLKGKYNEKDNLLKEGNIKYFDILDKEIVNMEFEVKKLEKELENLVNNNYKVELCKHYMSSKGCDKIKEKCNYAHGKDDLRKKRCQSYEKCWNKYCEYDHPKNWNYKDNIKICDYYINGFCRKGDDCNFKHVIKDENNNKLNEKIDKEVLDINNINEFPLSKNNNEDNKNENLPNIEISINEIEYNDIDERDKNKENVNDGFYISEEKEDNTDEDIECLILDFKKSFEKYSNEIKYNIDKLFVEDKKIGINMKLELNKIMSKISLFENNYHDYKLINK